MITKDDIIEGITICSQIENSYYNGKYPNSSYKNPIKKIRHILECLLKIDDNILLNLKDLELKKIDITHLDAA